MSLEKVIQNVKAEGQRAADTEIAKAKQEAAAIVADAEKQAATLKARRQSEASAAAEALKRRELASAELAAKKIRLDAEKDVLEGVRAQVVDAINRLGDNQRAEHLKALAGAATIPDGTLLVAPRDEELAKKAGLPVSGTANVLGGVIVVSPDGQLREDLTYEALLAEVWGRSLHDVAQALFK